MNNDDIKKLMEALVDVSDGNLANISLNELTGDMEVIYDRIYVKLREEYSEDIAKQYLDAMNKVWLILEKIQKN